MGNEVDGVLGVDGVDGVEDADEDGMDIVPLSSCFVLDNNSSNNVAALVNSPMRSARLARCNRS